MKILMVCLGNICRSPLAEGILKSKVKNKNIMIDSAGTSSYHIGSKPDIRSIKIAEKYNINISSQRARQFNMNDFNTFDIIYAMDNQNYQDLFALAKTEKQRNKIRLILEVLQNKKNNDVPDPYLGGDKGFELVYQMLEEACEKISSSLE